jgi:DNA-directed RNA polymerase subunit RPC12/RpoP
MRNKYNSLLKEGLAMKHILRKDINLSLIFVILSVVALVGGFIKWPLFIFAGVFLIFYIILDKKRLRCPNCGGYENLDRLMYAKNHVFHCKHCGEKIDIQ